MKLKFPRQFMKMNALSKLDVNHFTADDIRDILGLWFFPNTTSRLICKINVDQGIFEEVESGVYKFIET